MRATVETVLSPALSLSGVQDGLCMVEDGLSQAPYCYAKTLCPEATWGGKSWFTLLILGYSPFRKAKVEPEAGAGEIAYWLSLMASSACFIIHPKTTCPGVATSTVGWSLPHQSLIKKVPLGLDPTGWSQGCIVLFVCLFPLWFPVFN
jgi:hypothetical protein